MRTSSSTRTNRGRRLTGREPYSRTFREGSFSEIGGSKPATNIPFIALRALSPRDPAAFCRDIVTPAARICYEELQVVAAELPENYSCVDQRATQDDFRQIMFSE